MTSTKATQAPRHKEGSRKAKVHDLFDRQGQDAAWTLGLKLKLAQGTLRSWFGTWRREATPVKRKPAKQIAKSKAAKPTSTSKAAAASETIQIVTPTPDQPESIPVFLNG